MTRAALAILLTLLLLALAATSVAQTGASASPAPPQPSAAPPPASSALAPAVTSTGGDGDAVKEEARAHFDLGLSHFDREEWQGALVEFLRSRQIFPSKNNTKNAAICLRKVGRFDEALAMFETLLRDFPNLSPTDRALAERESAELQASVGTVEVRDAPAGATVTIDAVERGTAPLASPVRLAAGGHVVRVTFEGALPFEARIDLAGRQALIVHATLAALTQAGRLRVAVPGGPSLRVLIDGAVVGASPWEGALAPGPHTLSAEGEGPLGVAPRRVVVKLNEVVVVELVAAELKAALRVEAKPGSAAITIDGEPVGQGSWQGRLASGPHHVTAELDGYTPFSGDVMLADYSGEVVTASLVPSGQGRSGLAFEMDTGVPLGGVWGGGLYGGCGSCSAGLPMGFDGLFHATYELPSRLGLGLQAGYTYLRAALDQRPESIASVGISAPQKGSVRDVLSLNGLRAGVDGRYVISGAWPVTLRLAMGTLISSVKDGRTGTFTDSRGKSFAAAAVQSDGADYLYFGPEARVGRKLGEHFEINVGLEILALAAIKTPAWSSGSSLVASGADGEGTFPNASLTGGFLLVLTPGVGLKYEP